MAASRSSAHARVVFIGGILTGLGRHPADGPGSDSVTGSMASVEAGGQRRRCRLAYSTVYPSASAFSRDGWPGVALGPAPSRDDPVAAGCFCRVEGGIGSGEQGVEFAGVGGKMRHSDRRGDL